MTNEEKRKRIELLEKGMNKLRKERDKLQKQINNDRQKKELKKRMKLVGKCFSMNTMSDVYLSNENSNIKAFKVLEVFDYPTEGFAKCLILYDSENINWYQDKSIKIGAIGLWIPNELRLVSDPSQPMVIDFYDEISNEEFESLFNDYLGSFKKYI